MTYGRTLRRENMIGQNLQTLHAPIFGYTFGIDAQKENKGTERLPMHFDRHKYSVDTTANGRN